MADPAPTDTPAPKKRRAPQGPRQQRPIFAIVSYTDAEGALQTLESSRLSIAFERDSAKLLEALLPGGSGMQASAVVRVTLPAPTPRAKAAGAA